MAKRRFRADGNSNATRAQSPFVVCNAMLKRNPTAVNQNKSGKLLPK